MQFFRIMSVLLLLGTTVLPALALQIPKYNVSLSEVIATVEKPFSFDRSGSPQITDVRADFFQRSTSSSESLKFRFDYYRPTKQEIVCDGRTLWIYLPENRQVIQSDVAEFFEPSRANSASDRGINFLQGLGRISKDFSRILCSI